MTLRRLTPIDGEAILPLEAAKQHLRIRHDDEDGLIESLRDAAALYVERVSGVALAPADFEWIGGDDLPMRPVTAQSSAEGDGETVWTFTAGFDEPPADLLAAVKLMLGHLYENREAAAVQAVAEIPLGVDALIQTYRRVLV